MKWPQKPIGIAHNTYDSGIVIYDYDGDFVSFSYFYSDMISTVESAELEYAPIDDGCDSEAYFVWSGDRYFLSEFIRFDAHLKGA